MKSRDLNYWRSGEGLYNRSVKKMRGAEPSTSMRSTLPPKPRTEAKADYRFKIGDRVKVYWDGNNCWYEGEVLDRKIKRLGPASDSFGKSDHAMYLVLYTDDMEMSWESDSEFIQLMKNDQKPPAQTEEIEALIAMANGKDVSAAREQMSILKDKMNSRGVVQLQQMKSDFDSDLAGVEKAIDNLQGKLKILNNRKRCLIALSSSAAATIAEKERANKRRKIEITTSSSMNSSSSTSASAASSSSSSSSSLTFTATPFFAAIEPITSAIAAMTSPLQRKSKEKEKAKRDDNNGNGGGEIVTASTFEGKFSIVFENFPETGVERKVSAVTIFHTITKLSLLLLLLLPTAPLLSLLLLLLEPR